jgi:hypothetical protein
MPATTLAFVPSLFGWVRSIQEFNGVAPPSAPILSPQEQQDFDLLVRGLLSAVSEHLQDRTPFVPWAAVVSHDGQVSATKVLSPPGDSAGALPTLYETLRSKSPRLRAAAIVVDCGSEDSLPIVRIECEHREGAALVVAIPWRRAGDGEVTMLGSGVTPGAPRIWAE